MIPYNAIINELIPQEVVDLLPKGVPPPAFADDSSLPMKIPETKAAHQQLEEVLHNLEAVTGLSVNPAKSKVLLLKDDPSEIQLKLLAD